MRLCAGLFLALTAAGFEPADELNGYLSGRGDAIDYPEQRKESPLSNTRPSAAFSETTDMLSPEEKAQTSKLVDTIDHDQLAEEMYGHAAQVRKRHGQYFARRSGEQHVPGAHRKPATDSILQFTSPNHVCSWKMTHNKKKIVSTCPLKIPGVDRNALMSRVQRLRSQMDKMSFAMVEMQDHLADKDAGKFERTHRIPYPKGYVPPTPGPTTPPPTPGPTLPETCWMPKGDDIRGEGAFDELGLRNSVDLAANGKVLAVGSGMNDGSGGRNVGHVRVYEFAAGAWRQLGATLEGQGSQEHFGAAVDLSADGNTMAVGAHGGRRVKKKGLVRVYSWEFRKQLWVQKGPDIVGEEDYDYSGAAIDMSADGTVVAIGAYQNSDEGDNAGHVRVYEWNPASQSWVQRGHDLDGEEMYGSSGVSVDLSADGYILAVGAHENTVEEERYHAGHVRVWEWDGELWMRKGEDIDGEAEEDYSGEAIDLSDGGDILAIGAYRNDGKGATDSGHVRVYEWSERAQTWWQMGADIDGEAPYDNFGVSVSLSADGYTLAVGAWGADNDNGKNAGHARIYKWTGSEWVRFGATILGEERFDHSGSSVDLSADGKTVAVGAKNNANSGKTNAGNVRVYTSDCSVARGQSAAERDDWHTPAPAPLGG